MRLFGPYSWTLVFPSLFLHCFKSTSLPPLLPHSTLFNLLSFHSTLPNGSFMFIPYFSTISPPIIPIHVHPFRSFSFFLFVYRDLLPFHHLHSKFYPLFLPCSSCSFATPCPPLSLSHYSLHHIKLSQLPSISHIHSFNSSSVTNLSYFFSLLFAVFQVPHVLLLCITVSLGMFLAHPRFRFPLGAPHDAEYRRKKRVSRCHWSFQRSRKQGQERLRETSVAARFVGVVLGSVSFILCPAIRIYRGINRNVRPAPYFANVAPAAASRRVLSINVECIALEEREREREREGESKIGSEQS